MLPGIMGIMAGIGGAAGAAPSITQTDSRTTGATTFSSVSFGADDATRQIVLLVSHGDTATAPGNTPTATIGGVSATRINAQTTGDGSADATGSAIFIASPTGTTGTVDVTWGVLNVRIVVLRLTGYSATATSTGGEAGASSDGQISLTNTTNGCIIGLAGSGKSNSAISWTNITSGGDENVGGANNRRTWAWDTGTIAGSLAIGVSPWSAALGANSIVGATFPAL